MTDARKFLLVDPSSMNRMSELFQTDQRLQPLRTTEIKRLDGQMLDIVNDQFLSEEAKVKKYNSALAEFQNLARVIPKKYDYSEHKTGESKALEKDKSELKANHLVGIGKPYQKKANDLLELLSNFKGFKVNKTGEIQIGENELKGSNIADFLNKAVNPKAKVQYLSGWDKFQSLMSRVNVPQSLVSRSVAKELTNIDRFEKAVSPRIAKKYKRKISEDKPKEKTTVKDKLSKWERYSSK